MLTIISVSFKSKRLLEINHQLVTTLNPGVDFKWIVVQNTPEADQAADLQLDDPRFSMMRGPVLTDQEKASFGYGSIHHAKALNIALSYTDSDLVLTLDPDCFILQPDWIKRVTQYIRDRRLAFFGTPYHPRNFRTYRDFPTAVCMFVDRRRLQERDLFTFDFSPSVDRRRDRKAVRQGLVHHTLTYKNFLGFFLNIARQPRHPALTMADWPMVTKAWIEQLVPQLQVASYKDTGWRVWKQYHDTAPHEELQVYAVDPRSRGTRLLETLLPDGLRTFPRLRGQVRQTANRFLEELGDNCEQFYWRDRLFAFHVNGTWYKPEFRNQAYEMLIRKLEQVIEGEQRSTGDSGIHARNT